MENHNDRQTILLVDDDSAALEALVALFEDDYEVLKASSGESSLEMVRTRGAIAAVVMDIRMSGMDGIAAAREVRRIAPDTPVIFHTGYPGDYDQDQIDEQEKPFDYVQKADPISKLTRAVRNAVDAYRARTYIARLSESAGTAFGIVGRSQAIRNVLSVIYKVAPSEKKVVIQGKTGTGKELVARAIHLKSGRANQRLVIFNCNHKAPDLVESELFGHTRGAFTGAIADRQGLFEYADGGTIFLDEIGDLDYTTQAKLLRVLETGEYQRVGSPRMSTTDVRLICATHRNLETMVREESFREDLYYRLKGVLISLPPLCARREDIPLLVECFKDRYTIECDLPPKYFDQAAMRVLVEYDWPGNVRQLQDVIETLVTLTDSDIIVAADIERELGLSPSSDNTRNGSKRLKDRLLEYRRTVILEALQETGNNISAAARLLCVDRSNLRKMIQDHDLHPE